MEERLGKIEKVRFGLGGYQDAMLGLSVMLSGDGWGVGDFKGSWSLMIDCTERCKWTVEDRDKQFAETMRFVNQLLTKAKKESVDELKGIPVRVKFEGSALKSWEILAEVL